MRACWSIAPFASLCICACTADVKGRLSLGCRSQTVIYGADDRAEPATTQGSNADTALHSAVALIPTAVLDALASQALTWDELTLAAGGVCEDERFADQPAVVQCSGTLIAEDLVLTAAHCVKGPLRCRDYTFVLGYALTTAGEQPSLDTAAHLYHCREVLVDLSAFEVGADAAVVRLDRSVEAPFQAANLRSSPIVAGEHVLAATFALGTPLKIDDGGSVREVRLRSFSSDVDTFIHSSGGSLFDETGALMGVLVRGQQDFIEDGACLRARRANADDETYELAVAVPSIRAALCAADERLCANTEHAARATHCDSNPQPEEVP